MVVEFGKTGLKTSSLVYGCMGSSGAFGHQEEQDSIDAIRTAFDVGVNFFDTAEGYADGYSEQLLGRALGHVRGKIIISSKVNPGNFAPEDLMTACERSLKNLGTDYLDIYLLHWPNREIPLAESIGALKDLQTQGKIRHYGVSNFGYEDIKKVSELGQIAANQVAYHLLFRAIEAELLPTCINLDIPVMCYSSLMQGLLAGKYKSLGEFPENRARTRLFDSRIRKQCRHGENGAEDAGELALAEIWKIVQETGIPMEQLSVGWLKVQPGIGGVLVGTRNAEQSRNLSKLLEIELESSVLDALTAITDDVKKKMGSNIDMWDHRTR